MISTTASPSPNITFVLMLIGLLGMASAAVLLAAYPEAMLTRWHPAMLAVVHLFALAGLLPVMLGALFQFVPVACGMAMAQWPWADRLIALALPAGAACMAWGFLASYGTALGAGASVVVVALGLVGGRLLWALWAQSGQGDLLGALRRSAVALAVTVTAGALLVASVLCNWPIALVAAVNWHALWAISGWLGGLILAVSSVVVPMFHVSTAYPRVWLRSQWALPVALVTGAVAAFAGADLLAQFAASTMALLALGFAVLTARRVAASKRGERDAFFWGWLVVATTAGVLALLGLAAAWLEDGRWTLSFGVVALVGAGGGSITVMLYRIVPFLIWLHWQRYNRTRQRLPLLHQIIAERGARGQSVLYLCALLALSAAPFYPAMTRLAGLGLALALLMQAALVLQAVRCYKLRLAQLQAA